MKKNIGALLAAGLLLGLSGSAENSNSLTPEDIDTTQKKAPIPKGLKYFPEYGVWAINEKNAKRKSKK